MFMRGPCKYTYGRRGRRERGQRRRGKKEGEREEGQRTEGAKGPLLSPDTGPALGSVCFYNSNHSRNTKNSKEGREKGE